MYIVTVEAEIGKEKLKEGDLRVRVYDLWGKKKKLYMGERLKQQNLDGFRLEFMK